MIILITASLICIPILLLIELTLLGHIDWMICYVSVSVCPLHLASPHPLTFMSFSPPYRPSEATSVGRIEAPSPDELYIYIFIYITEQHTNSRLIMSETLPLQIYTLGLDPFKFTEENYIVSDTICVPVRVNFQYVELFSVTFLLFTQEMHGSQM